METPYQRFKDEELILRDELAVDRTAARQRAHAAGLSTGGIALLLAGSRSSSSQAHWFTMLGVFCLPAGCRDDPLGAYRFRRMQRHHRSLRENRLPRTRATRAPEPAQHPWQGPDPQSDGGSSRRSLSTCSSSAAALRRSAPSRASAGEEIPARGRLPSTGAERQVRSTGVRLRPAACTARLAQCG